MSVLRNLIVLFLLLPLLSTAQTSDDWTRLRQYGNEIGVDSLCPSPDVACLTTYFTQIVYGKPPRRISYQGLHEQLDTVRINQLTQQFLAGTDWCPLLDSLESHDRNYRQLKEYCMRCLVDDYMADSLTIEQVKTTLNTYRWLNRFPAEKRVVINIPSASMRVIDRQGSTLLNSRVIVGKASTPTPCFTAQLTDIVTYPYWNVPRSIAIKELLPQIRKNPATVLAEMNLQIIDSKGRIVHPDSVNWSGNLAKTFPYRLRQSTGCDNALGVLKFTINSPFDIYLHDTNQRSLFAHEKRALSHGCIRVEKPIELANLALGSSRFNPSFLTTCQKQNSPKTIHLPHPIPVIITYNLLDIDETGAIVVNRDVYNWSQIDL
ncbi:L,D-transpeptidase family protein [Spirosoma sp. KCTC 42546]|uniref:L,D-transpeptidase family protein n=1 Tax=Spirosoma sp. KCTC 42546 TaxID=2520506 RepID=UPI0011592343|nr:L,D-transpeptidase family protein [Spirosoma sp. KCTC 42546]QDK77493.1 L,D-transpeptidase family protein [Spirosoma sp. KCTC 42546]